jgi:hypothetical protein
MSVVSGKATFSSTGSQMIFIGIGFNDVDFYAGPRDGVTETNQLFAIGHADPNKQFCHTTRDGSSETTQNKCMRLKDASGTVVLEFNVTGGWGTSIMTCNVTAANANYPFELVARS